ncbi:hypothetical protein AAFC00_000784 [Neodothiora populina]
MWDSIKRRWFAGAILWTCSPTRSLTPGIELNYLVAFGQSIMSEIAALGAKQADQAKGAFITNISHELRTPLHGILGSAECLQITTRDDYQAGLVHTIDMCGKTLLDTFDNLLSFAKINPLSRSNDTTSSEGGGVPKITIIGEEEQVRLGVLLEEVISTVFAGQEYQRTYGQRSADADIGGLITRISPHTLNHGRAKGNPESLDRIAVSVTYFNPESTCWNVLTQPGAWRRIVLNLAGIALKYTTQGFISVTLRNTRISGNPDASNYILTIADSGRGMSKQFVDESVFAPFVQEDPLSPGTGLGLSIVKRIVDNMNGTISIKSKQGRGTTFKVTVPLMRGTHVSAASAIHIVSDRRHDLKLNAVRDSIISNTSSDLVWTFAEISEKCFGMATDLTTDLGDERLYVTSAKHLRQLPGKIIPEFSRPDERPTRVLIVLCADSVTARALESFNTTTTFSYRVFCISQPIGPTKVANALAAIMGWV